MEWRRDDVEISPFACSSAFYPPRDVEGLCQVWLLPGVCYDVKVDGRSLRSQVLRSISPFFMLCLAVSLNRFLWPPRVPCVSCANTSSRGTVVLRSNTVTSPVDLVLHYHCLSTSSVGLHGDTGDLPIGYKESF